MTTEHGQRVSDVCEQTGSERPSHRGLEAVLRPFLEQSVRVTAIVALGWPRFWVEQGEGGGVAAPVAAGNDAALFRIAAGREDGPAIVARVPIPPREAHRLDTLARHARQLSHEASGDPLILLSAPALAEMIGRGADPFPFRAVVLLWSPESDHGDDGAIWMLQRALFDHGLVGIGSIPLAGGAARCFLASDAVRPLPGPGVESRGHVTMSTLGRNGAFGNQLFQYAYVKLYALRHGLTAALPEWQGRRLFHLDDPTSTGLTLPELSFAAFTDDDLLLWEGNEPPIDIDLWGYFQEIPPCWRPHRLFLRRLFRLPVEHHHAIDAWRNDVTRGGRRTLVAIHVRRGDYRGLQHPDVPWFRLVPTDWYLRWLRTIWPALCDPVLFVATDEPDAILPCFHEFEAVSTMPGPPAHGLPDHVRDFEILRRADYLALCNSSFGRMAAIVAHRTQRCFLPSFETQDFESYEPWIDPGFWARFGTVSRTNRPAVAPPLIERRRHVLTPHDDAPRDGATQSTMYFDVSDLLLYLRRRTALSGIQRVQCEILRHLVAGPCSEPIRLAVLDDVRGPCVIETAGFRDLVERIRAGAVPRDELEGALDTLLARAAPLFVRPRDILLTIGAFWSVRGAGLLLQELKNAGVTIGVLIHDVISVTDPEYFDVGDTRVFVKGLVEGLTFADFILTTSEYNRASVMAHMAARHLPPLPIHVVPLGHELAVSVPTGATISPPVAAITETDYVLCVGTVEVRKNPTYLFNIWRLMVRGGRSHVPTLVFVGRRGWLVQDFMDQLKACNYLDGRIVFLHDVTDVELALLYRKCILTMFPSLAEGWGLPVGESLAHGKVCIAARAGGIPEVGGELADYVDPYDARGGLEVLTRYLDDAEVRRRREREIARHFASRPWRSVADDFLDAAQTLARQVRPVDGVAAITLPPDRYLPISWDTGAIPLDGMDGSLSADLICISGWKPTDIGGVWADEPDTMIRFRTELPAGSRIVLVLRLTAGGAARRHIRIASGSGAETEAGLAGGSDQIAVLSCEVEPGNLVSARLSLAGTRPGDSHGVRAPYWGLKGILYFQPDRPGREVSDRVIDAPSSPPREGPPVPPLTPRVTDRPERASPPERVALQAAPSMDERHRAPSFGAFLHAVDSYWPSGLTAYRDAPIFADHADKQMFYAVHGGHVGAVTDHITLIRRSNQFVSMTRFSEGSVFDRAGVSRAFGYLQGSPPIPWLSRHPDGMWLDDAALDAAPSYDGSYAIFYNGNLHNYYHWMVEGILSLDILSRALGPHQKLRIVVPKSMDINALLDHRESLRAVELDGPGVEEVAAGLIRVREAIWVDSDVVQSMPAPYLRDFQQRLAARYATSRGPRNRRLLVARRGPTRTLRNLEQVQACLSRYGFETVYLEGMSVLDQILLFQSAEFVIGPHGAGLANLLFCEGGTKVIEFMPSAEMRPFFWLISEKLGLVHGVQFCPAADGHGFQAALTVDVGKLQALYRMVEAHG